MLPDDTHPIVSITSYPPTSPSHHREEGRKEESWTYALVEERLIEAMALWRRSPDRERAWLHVKAMWPEITREWAAGDYDARGYLGNSSDIPLRPLPLIRAEVGRMEEAGTWIGRYVPERDRRLVALALGFKASDRAVPWRWMLGKMGLTLGAHGLRMRYERGVGAIAKGLDAGQVPVRIASLGQ